MGCHTWFYEIRDKDTFEDIKTKAIKNCEEFINSFTNEELKNDFSLSLYKEAKERLIMFNNLDCPIMDLISYTDYRFINRCLCLPIKYDRFLFRTFNYDDNELFSLEETIEHIDKYYNKQNSLLFKANQLFYLLGIKMKIWFYKVFKNTSLGYTHTHYSQGTIELNENYENTIKEVKEFWNKYPNAVIQFG